jgi:hypothetical protein
MSPRLGGTFLLIERCGKVITRSGCYVITKRARIPWGKVVHHLSNELLFILESQRIKV